MLFNFRLRDVDKIKPWGDNHQKHLHWFGLTDGWYWINVGTDKLFCYSNKLLSLRKEEAESPYVDYYVVRFWEDLLDILPNILEPVPTNILQKTDFGASFAEWHNKILNHLLLQDNHDLSPKSQEILDNTTEWMARRFLNTRHLKYGPHITFSNDGQNIFIHWNNLGLTIDNIPIWTAQYGTFSLPINQFVESVQTFDKNLRNEMQARINEIQKNWEQSEIHIDIARLIQEQEERSTWLEQALERANTIKIYDWDEIQEMLEKIG